MYSAKGQAGFLKRLLRLRSGFLRFPRLFTAGEALFLGFVMRAGFQLVVFALVAIEMEDFLSVRAAHVFSFRIWRVVVKRTTLPLRKVSS
jgi:hypothetical protein